MVASPARLPRGWTCRSPATFNQRLILNLGSSTPCEFHRSVEITAPIEAVFAFHGNPHNVGKISPAWQSVRVIKGNPAARPEEEFEIEVRLLRIFPMRWRGVWREVNVPTRLVDEAIQSPFAFWRHRHLFERLDANRTRMTDHVSYLFPGGWWGKWFGETLGRLQFHLMFADRQKRTARFLHDHPSGPR